MADSGLDGCVVVGHSMGGQVAAELAASHPSRVGRLVLIGPTADVEARSVLGQFGRWLANAPHEPARFNALVLYEIAEMGPRWMLGTFGHAVECQLEERLAEVRCPVVLARGEGDRISPQRWLETLRGVVPGPPVATVAGAVHSVVYSHPEAVAGIVREV
jgi:pimeloyl-ACP methyl ester carboxylesterase